MEAITLIAITKQGLEGVVEQEVAALGLAVQAVSRGSVVFAATVADIPRANLWLRCADRVLLQVGAFRAVTFDELFEQVRTLPWERWIPRDGAFPVDGKSVQSTLQSVRSSQAIVKKAIAERLMAAYGESWLAESGAACGVLVSLLRDVATLTLDTSGEGLHKRGYRTEAVEAPLKETFAAGLVRLSQWRPDLPLVDPMCGSGTILIEAALLARGAAPGLQRGFAAEAWPAVPAAAWRAAREAAAARREEGALQLVGYDVDETAVAVSRANAARAGVAADIQFEQKDVRDMWIDRQYGVLISNPPYGQRMASFQEINQIYVALHKTFRKKAGWSVNVLTADAKFPDYFKRARPDRVRLFYNGRIRVNYYQFEGAMPA